MYNKLCKEDERVLDACRENFKKLEAGDPYCTEIWNRFKEASDIINKEHAVFYQSKKEEEVENLKNKTALCEKIEAIDVTKISSYKEWEKVTEQVLAIQADWKKIGFAPKKNNTKIYEKNN